MNFRILLVFFLLASNVTLSQELIIQGVFTGSNVYVVNPFTESDNTWSIESIFINDKACTGNIKSSAFEIDLVQMGFELGEALQFRIKYMDSIIPSIINQEAIQAISSFEIEKGFVDKEQFLNWQCTNEMGSLLFHIEQYRWDKWITIGQLKGIGTPALNHYKIKVPIHSGINKFRIHQIDHTDKIRYSEVIEYESSISPVFLVNKKVKSKLRFSTPTQFEIFDLFGNLIFDGFGKEVRFDDISSGKYYVNFDNTIGEFTKE